MSEQMISVGADPEAFVSDKSNIVSAIGLIGGSKEKPRTVKFGAIQEDNVLAEFNIDPATDADQFVHNINAVVAQLKQTVAPLDLSIMSSHEFTRDVLEKAGPKAMQFGCDPDYNAWTLGINDTPDANTSLRTAGGHIHVGFNLEDEHLSPFMAAIMMDFYLGLPSVLLDDDVRRRGMYGKAGACRPKLKSQGDPYNGVEYRTLSNFWLRDEATTRWAFDNTITAIREMPNFHELIKKYDGEEIQDIINNSDKEKASAIISEIGIAMPKEV